MAPWDINCWLVIKHYEPALYFRFRAHTHFHPQSDYNLCENFMRVLVLNVNTVLMVVMRTLTLTLSVFVLCEHTERERGNTLNWQLPL